MQGKEWLQVGSEHLNKRLDVVLSLSFPEYSRSYFQKLIEEGCVLINDKIPKKKDLLTLGDEICIVFKPSEEIDVEPENIPLDILYEDEYFLAINKPSGLVVHPAPGHPNGTFVNALLYHCASLEKGKDLRPGIIHRLDKETSGVLIAAKTSASHMAFSELFSERKIKKTYIAICIGNPGDITIDAPLSRHPVHRKEMSVSKHEKAKSAITVCRTLAHRDHLSFVELDLITGRTHQIRVHLKYKGFPILGDATYGSEAANKKYGAKRQLLHAHRLGFEHPFTHEKIDILAPIPEDIQVFIHKIG